ncbi:hypothetical protein CC78DRAFT_581006 [Lojkania enalia]|uniref:Uncharacterized protein n=1 Tax=Lojkania enalia TaxID=147567 RepID=A0A9P4K6U3_9PLEO|nr:hypothetical protein CC78DRAFT_581006 [Didymosphaeria enalia]
MAKFILHGDFLQELQSSLIDFLSESTDTLRQISVSQAEDVEDLHHSLTPKETSIAPEATLLHPSTPLVPQAEGLQYNLILNETSPATDTSPLQTSEPWVKQFEDAEGLQVDLTSNEKSMSPDTSLFQTSSQWVGQVEDAESLQGDLAPKALDNSLLVEGFQYDFAPAETSTAATSESHRVQTSGSSRPLGEHLILELHKDIAGKIPLSESEARDPKYYVGCLWEEERENVYNYLICKLILLSCGDFSFASGYWPRGILNTGYVFAPTSNPEYPDDITSFEINSTNAKNELAPFHEGNLPLPTSFIDELRMFLDYDFDYTPLEFLYHETGEPILGVNGEHLRNIKILPRHISTAVEGWRLHYWFSMDLRIRFTDIWARMNFSSWDEGGVGPMELGRVQMEHILKDRLRKFRTQHGILAPDCYFDPTTYCVTPDDMEAIGKLSPTQLKYGVWWEVDEEKGVMYQPNPMNEATPWQKVYYTLPLKTGMSERVKRILEHKKLMEKMEVALESYGPVQVPAPPRGTMSQITPESSPQALPKSTPRSTPRRKRTASESPSVKPSPTKRRNTGNRTTPAMLATPPRSNTTSPSRKTTQRTSPYRAMNPHQSIQHRQWLISTPPTPPNHSLMYKNFITMTQNERASLLLPVLQSGPQGGIGASRQREALSRATPDAVANK